MKTFKDFLIENKNEKRSRKKMWSEIETHDRALDGPEKETMDKWVGHSHEDIDRSRQGHPTFHLPIMIPTLDENPDKVHARGQPIRDVLKRYHGTHITLYRGESPNAIQSSGRLNNVSSWTTNKRVAHYFANDQQRHRSIKIYSPKEISAYEKTFNQKGKVKFGNNILQKNDEEGGIDLFDKHGDHIVGGYDSVKDYFDTEKPSNLEYNKEKNDAARSAATRIKKIRVPIDDVVWATNRAGQEEVIIRNRKDK